MRGWRGSDAEQSAAEGREPNLRRVGRRREEDDRVGMQQRTETEKKNRKEGAENKRDLRIRVKIERKERCGGGMLH